MHVSKDHLAQIEQAVATAEPLLLLPSLHPRYIQSLLGDWCGAGGKRKVKLVEPYMGCKEITADGVVEGSGASDEDLADWLSEAADDLASTWQRVWWIPDLEAAWADPRTLAVVSSVCRKIGSRGYSLRIATRMPTGPIPPALQAWARPVELLTPKAQEDEQNSFSIEVLSSEGPHSGADRAALLARLDRLKTEQRNPRAELSSMLQGLDAAAVNIVIEAVARWRRSQPDKPPDQEWKALKERLEQERARQLQRASGLTIEKPSTDTLEGMPRFQRYLEYVSVLFHDRRFERKEGGPTPRGVLLVGLPGCGKSLAARVTAQKLDVPLLRLDVGAMMGRYLGESEANLRRALDAAEAAAPCVLWVDELEKALGGLGGSGEGGGTGTRMLGQLLTWMQDHDSSVYLFATANKVDHLPPELLRRGRFDELWRVMLPREDEREAILRQKLGALNDECDPALLKKGSKQLKQLVTDTKDYTGADLTSLVREAWMRARVFEQKVTADAIQKVRKGDFQPMSLQFSDQIKKDIEKLKKHGFRDVWCAKKELPEPPPEDRTGKGGRLVGALAELWRTTEPLLGHFVAKTKGRNTARTVVFASGEGPQRVLTMFPGRLSWENMAAAKGEERRLIRNGRHLTLQRISGKKSTTNGLVQLDENERLNVVIDSTSYTLNGKLLGRPGISTGVLQDMWKGSVPQACVFQNDDAFFSLVINDPPEMMSRSGLLYPGDRRTPWVTKAAAVSLVEHFGRIQVEGVRRAGRPMEVSVIPSGSTLALRIGDKEYPCVAGPSTEYNLLPPEAQPWFTYKRRRYIVKPQTRGWKVTIMDSRDEEVGVGTVVATKHDFLVRLHNTKGFKSVGLANHRIFWDRPQKAAGRSKERAGRYAPGDPKAKDLNFGGNWNSLVEQFKR